LPLKLLNFCSDGAPGVNALLADIQKTGSLADEPSPYFANTQQHYRPSYGSTGEKTILTYNYNVFNIQLFIGVAGRAEALGIQQYDLPMFGGIGEKAILTYIMC